MNDSLMSDRTTYPVLFCIVFWLGFGNIYTIIDVWILWSNANFDGWLYWIPTFRAGVLKYWPIAVSFSISLSFKLMHSTLGYIIMPAEPTVIHVSIQHKHKHINQHHNTQSTSSNSSDYARNNE